ncbi:MAG TPA: nitroreductase family protein [Terriglobales bacterium]|jgi:nitroreductase
MSTNQINAELEFPDNKKAQPNAPILEAMRERWSPRAFDASRPVSAQDLTTIFEAARWAASSYNEQPWRFVVGRKGDATWQKIFDTLIPGNQAWAQFAPVLLITFAKKTFSHDGSQNKYGFHDIGAALAHIMLEATALGLHTHGMAGFDYAKARQTFGVPDDFEVGAACAIGYLGDPNELQGWQRDAELKPRTRKPLDELVFADTWGTSANFWHQ